MSNNKTCIICYNNNTNDNLKCKTCKNCICSICYANIVFNHQNFIYNFVADKSIFKCPFCKNENTFSTKINNFDTNNRLIKLSIKTIHDNNIEFNNLVDDLNIARKQYYELQDELNKLKNINYNLSTEVKTFKLNLEYKPSIDKLKEIEDVIKNTKKTTILFNQINSILNK